MPVSVADASAVGAMLFGEPAAERIAAALEGHGLVAPTLLTYEVASIGLKKIAARPAQEAQVLEALALFPALQIRQYAVPISDVVSTAKRYKLTAYDASYLWLAAELGVGLVTLDEVLARAWKRHRG